MLGCSLGEKNGKSVEIKDCCYDVPLLQSLLKMDVVRDQASLAIIE